MLDIVLANAQLEVVEAEGQEQTAYQAKSDATKQGIGEGKTP